MELKKLTLGDKAIIAELFRDVFTHAPWNDGWDDAPAQLDAYLTDLISSNCSLALGCFEGEHLVGLALGRVIHWHTGTEYSIDEFCIARSMQGKGIGSAWLREIESYLLKNGIRRIFLQTERSVPAYDFYLRRGFRELDAHVSFLKELDGDQSPAS